MKHSNEMTGKERKDFIVSRGVEHKGQRDRYHEGKKHPESEEMQRALVGMKNIELEAEYVGMLNLKKDLQFLRERDCI